MANISGATIEQSIFISAYLEAALWTEEFDDININDLPQETVEAAKVDCLKFLSLCDDWFGMDASLEQAGHDFWLTRNGHGAGFWDRPKIYGQANADKLTDISKQFGEKDFYIGDDKLVYFS